MEKFIIKYNNKKTNYTAEVYAQSEEEAVREVEKKTSRSRNSFRITEIIPQGIVSGFEVRLVGSKIVHI